MSLLATTFCPVDGCACCGLQLLVVVVCMRARLCSHKLACLSLLEYVINRRGERGRKRGRYGRCAIFAEDSREHHRPSHCGFVSPHPWLLAAAVRSEPCFPRCIPRFLYLFCPVHVVPLFRRKCENFGASVRTDCFKSSIRTTHLCCHAFEGRLVPW